MDAVLEKLSNLETLWRITGTELNEKDSNDEEVDIFALKTTETRVRNLLKFV